MSVVAEVVAPSTPVLSHVPWWRGKIVQTAGIIALMYLAYRAWGVTVDASGQEMIRFPWPDSLIWHPLSGHLDTFQVWLLTEKGAADRSFVFALFDGFSTSIDHFVDWFNRLLLWMTWIGTTVAGVLVVARFGGLRAALITLVAFATFALTGLWEESMQTVALMLVAVGLSLLIGIPLGIVAGRSDRFAKAITPVLDAMQIVPAFAYLIPVVILFSIGPAAAVVSTLIYAIPPAIRITALGIRGVAVNTVEAATSLGATRSQLLRKVQLPLARRLILLGVNQTILFALSMVVIAGLIGGGGLGAVVTSGLYSNPALAILAGFVIVIMATALDRSTEAMAARTDPAHRHLDESRRKRLRLQSLATCGRDSRCDRDLEGVRRQRHLPRRGRRSTAERDHRGVASVEDPGRPRLRAGPHDLGVRHHRADRDLHPPTAPAADAGIPRRGSVVHDARRADADRLRRQRAPTGADRARDARPDRSSWASGHWPWTPSRRCSSRRRWPSCSASSSACSPPRTTVSPRR